jgi:glyoxylate utilization-related uncharacterized protein
LDEPSGECAFERGAVGRCSVRREHHRSHRDAAEAFYVLAGEYVIFLEDREFICPAGSFIYIPVGHRHGFRVGSVPSRKLNLYSPAAMVGYFDELSAAITTNHADADLDAIANRHGMEVVSPVPDGYL